jgi:DnaJ-domain-containing protein 1
MAWFDALLQGLGQIQNQVQQTLGECAVCGEPALPLRCRHCGEFTCLAHSYVNVGGTVVCSGCVDEKLPPHRRRKNDPFAVLGIPPTADEAEINAAFRRLSKDCHPDLHPDDPGAVKRFHELTRARDRALEKKC